MGTKKQDKNRRISLGKRVETPPPGWYVARLKKVGVKKGRGGNEYVEFRFCLEDDPRYRTDVRLFANFSNRLALLQDTVAALFGRELRDDEEPKFGDLENRRCMVRVEEGDTRSDPYARKIVEVERLDPENEGRASIDVKPAEEGELLAAESVGQESGSDQPTRGSYREFAKLLAKKQTDREKEADDD